MLNHLPYEIIVKILNILLPYDNIIPFNNIYMMSTYFDITFQNLNNIFHSNKNIINLVKSCIKIKNIVYNFGINSLYFNNEINICAILLYKPKRIYAPNDDGRIIGKCLRYLYHSDITITELILKKDNIGYNLKDVHPCLKSIKYIKKQKK